MAKKIALMVIHGIGDQKPFETMDAFVRGFAESYARLLSASGPGALKARHNLTRFEGWVESYVALIPEAANSPEIHIYEYYWAYMAERQITATEVITWAHDVIKGADKFYKNSDPVFSKDSEIQQFKKIIGQLKWLSALQGILAPFLGLFLYPMHFMNVAWAGTLIKRIVKTPLEKYVGDVALYSGTDMKSKYYSVRSAILKGSYTNLLEILRKTEYEKVFVCGHSLGSVIAYDTLARLNKEMNVDEKLRVLASKISGLVTFGSPLDKISFFFDERVEKNQAIRAAIISQLYGFRKKGVNTPAVESGIEQYFERLKWLNFWRAADPVSGRLDVYRDVENIEMVPGEKMSWWRPLSAGKNHSSYFSSEKMHEKIIRDFGLVS